MSVKVNNNSLKELLSDIKNNDYSDVLRECVITAVTELDTSEVTDMKKVFGFSPYNRPIGNWNVSSVTNMSQMFYSSLFNHPIGNWDVSNVTDMTDMFKNSNFKQDLEAWSDKLHPDVKVLGMFKGSPMEGNEPSWYHERAVKQLSKLENALFSIAVLSATASDNRWQDVLLSKET